MVVKLSPDSVRRDVAVIFDVILINEVVQTYAQLFKRASNVLLFTVFGDWVLRGIPNKKMALKALAILSLVLTLSLADAKVSYQG